ncbi:MAG: pentapeptide repeat-containing protein [Pirellulales bacterium]
MQRTVRWLRAGALLLASTASAPSRADIFRWDNGQLIPGTEGITPEPGVVLDRRNLDFAQLSARDLTGASFKLSNLAYASFDAANLTGVNLRQANLSYADLFITKLANALFDDAIVTEANLGGATGGGLTQQQLYSTASYKVKDLQGIGLDHNDLSGWNLAGQNLTSASFYRSTLANLNLQDAVVLEANFGDTTRAGFSPQQLYSTASYQLRDLQNIQLPYNDLSGWNFFRQEMTGASLRNADLTGTVLAGANLTNATFIDAEFRGTDLAGAHIRGARLWGATSHGFGKEELYSTASYQRRDLQEVTFYNDNLAGWDFRGQDMADASLYGCDLTGANFASANLANVDFSVAQVAGADFSAADLRNAGNIGDLEPALSRNTILSDGQLKGLILSEFDSLVVRDYDARGTLGRPIPVRVDEQMVIRANGNLRLVFDSDSWDSTISFQPSIPVELGGSLELTFAAEVDPTTQIGRTFKLFDWTGVNPAGQFNVVSDYQWDTANLYSTGEVTLIPEPATLASAATAAILVLLATMARQRRTLHHHSCQPTR